MNIYIYIYIIYNIYYVYKYISACINQDSSNPAEQLNGSMERIIGSCDLMVTPIYDPSWEAWSWEGHGVLLQEFEDYQAPAFKTYLERGWCRLEMFYNANVPMNAARAKLFGSKLRQVMEEQRRRPQLLFGTREKDKGDMPIVLPALRDELFNIYHPAEGDLTSKGDAEVINACVQELFRINRNLQVCSHVHHIFRIHAAQTNLHEHLFCCQHYLCGVQYIFIFEDGHTQTRTRKDLLQKPNPHLQILF
jgi:hypothetical protein